MKTAVSMPDELFSKADDLARRLNKTRSQLYQEALAEYLDRRDPQGIRAKIDRVCDEVGQEGDDGFLRPVGGRCIAPSGNHPG